MGYRPFPLKKKNRISQYADPYNQLQQFSLGGISLNQLWGYFPFEESVFESTFKSKYFPPATWPLSDALGAATYQVTGKVGLGVQPNITSGGLRRALLPVHCRFQDTKDFTLCGWIKLNSKATDQIIVWQTNGLFANNHWNFALYYDTAVDRFVWSVGDNTVDTNVDKLNADNLGSPNVGQYYFIVVSHQINGLISISVNNGIPNTKTPAFRPINSSSAFMFGGSFSDAPTRGLDGVLDNWSYFGRLFTPNEIRLLYNNDNGIQL